MEQLALADIEIQQKQAKIHAIIAELDRRFKAVALSIDRSDFATLNNKSYSYVCEILNTNNESGQKPFQLGLVPSLIVERPDLFKSEVIDFLCDLVGWERSEEKISKLTPEQELKMLKKKIREHQLESIFAEVTK